MVRYSHCTILVGHESTASFRNHTGNFFFLIDAVSINAVAYRKRKSGATGLVYTNDNKSYIQQQQCQTTNNNNNNSFEESQTLTFPLSTNKCFIYMCCEEDALVSLGDIYILQVK